MLPPSRRVRSVCSMFSAHRHLLERGAHLEGFGDLRRRRAGADVGEQHQGLEAAFGRDAAQVNARVRPGLDHAQRRQGGERLAQCIAADAELLGERTLGREPVAGLEVALLQVGEDGADDVVRGVLAEDDGLARGGFVGGGSGSGKAIVHGAIR
jgi:hypothetical protein